MSAESPIDFQVHRHNGLPAVTEIRTTDEWYIVATYSLDAETLLQYAHTLDPLHAAAIFEGRCGEVLVLNWREIAGLSYPTEPVL
jgi:hypothetical protein